MQYLYAQELQNLQQNQSIQKDRTRFKQNEKPQLIHLKPCDSFWFEDFSNLQIFVYVQASKKSYTLF